MSEVIPEGWLVHALDRGVEILSGYPFQSSLFTDDSREIGLIRIRDLDEQNVATFYKGDFDEVYIVRQGDVLIGMDGDFNIVKWKAKRALLNQRICKIKASKNSGFCTDFLFHSLIVDLQKIHSETGATTVKHLSVKDIRSIEKAYPPLIEQQKIAAVLSSVDEVIEKTRAQIDKLKDLKTGMIQELLTKGIGHTEFKDSPLGRIPASWNVYPLDSLAILSRGRFSHRPRNDPMFYGGKYPFLQTGDVPKESIVIRTYSQTLNEKGYGVSKLFPKGTLVMTIAATIGEIGILDFDACFPDSLVGITVKSDMVDTYYLAYALKHLSHELGSLAPQTAQKNINLEILSPFEMPVPPISEQKLIASSIGRVDAKLENLLGKLHKIESLKKSLMQDLLTGKVRVKLDQPETTAA